MIEVPRWERWSASIFEAFGGFFKQLAHAETASLSKGLPADRRPPVYICGLARSGTSILLHALAELPGLGTYRVSDFPFVLTPTFVRRFWKLAAKPGESQERSHGDRIEVNGQSPEALDELIWQQFLGLHQPSADRIPLLAPSDLPTDFRRVYQDTISKLLICEQSPRYLAKNNYLTNRLHLLSEIVPSASVLVCVRHPLDHVASLLRQHQRFTAATVQNPQVARQMQRRCHFEFGTQVRPVDHGNQQILEQSLQARTDGDWIRYFALQWADAYQHLKHLCDHAPPGVTLLPVSYERLCADSEAELCRLLSFLDEAAPDGWLDKWSTRLKAPSYAERTLDDQSREIVFELTTPTAEAWGLPVSPE